MTSGEVPTNIAIGTQKAASTYLYNLLKSHPDVTLSEKTEVDFYSAHYDKGLEWYLNTYSSKTNRIDISPKYFMQGSLVAPRIKETLRETRPKLLLILRNPIEYVNSHFRMQIQQHFFEKSDQYPNFTNDLADFIEQYPEYSGRGKYHQVLTDQWLNIFELSDFKVVIFEELIDEKHQTRVLNEILTFWNLDEHELSAPGASKNRALRHPFLHRAKDFVMKHDALKEYLKNQVWFNKLYQNVLTSNSRDALSDRDRKRLAPVFADDVMKLRSLLKQDIPQWRDWTS